MMHMKVGAGALLVLFCLGSGAMSTPQTRPAGGTIEDGEFLRRVMLDLVGYPPNLDQVKAFIAKEEANKRSAKVDELLGSEEWADYWSRLFCEVYFGNYHEVVMDTMP